MLVYGTGGSAYSPNSFFQPSLFTVICNTPVCLELLVPFLQPPLSQKDLNRVKFTRFPLPTWKWCVAYLQVSMFAYAFT